MFNMQGEVIGVVSHILSQSGGFEGLVFVVTVKTAEDILLKQRTGWSGMQSYMLQGGLADIFNLPQKKGMLVQRIAPGSPAEKLGLVESNIPVKIGEESFMVGGDIILGIDGISLAETNGYVKIKNHLNSLPKGSKVTLQILRAGIKRELTFKKER
jgi:S1-C subfamily serine protease